MRFLQGITEELNADYFTTLLGHGETDASFSDFGKVTLVNVEFSEEEF